MSFSTNFGWKKSLSVFGTVSSPIAIVEILNSDGEWQEFELKIDSSAVITLMNPGDCALLGYTLNDGEEKILTTASNSELKVRVHRMKMKIGDDVPPIEVRTAFAVHDVPSLLLGILDIFNSFDISMRGHIRQTDFNYVS
ncbi:MAG TPA: hypothetical protein VHH33_01505 [Nitrososphaeraceae archaeon]|jgi:hypothetical protein|nr:hypothetical protein [Nitrososphaeraceae archaeon]